MEHEIRVELIADLMKIKYQLLPQYPLTDERVINPNITYCVFETIIAVLMDKYEVNSRDVRRILMLKDLPTTKE